MTIFAQAIRCRVIAWSCISMLAVALAGCGGDSADTAGPEAMVGGDSQTAADPDNNNANSTTANSAPVVSGNPIQALNAGMKYNFQPSATDPDGDTLTFSIQNCPTWAAFDAATGRLSGRPSAADIGLYHNVRIGVSDGEDSASLAPFSIDVAQFSNGVVTLSWVAPTSNTDGSTLTDLVGYKIVYGTDKKDLYQSMKIGNPSVDTHVVENLSPATWYFAVKAVSSNGAESNASNLTSKTIL